MTAYERVLPDIFPYVVTFHKSDIAEIAAKLTGTRTDVPALSSFCVTPNVYDPQSKVSVWLSNTSMEFLIGNGNGLPGRITKELRATRNAQDEARKALIQKNIDNVDNVD